LISGPTTLITAHYHAAVGAVVVSRMGMTYLAASELALAVTSVRAANRQIGAYALGLLLLSGGLVLAATENAPRKTSAAATTDKGMYYRAGMAVSGGGGVLAMIGAVWLVVNLTRRSPARKRLDKKTTDDRFGHLAARTLDTPGQPVDSRPDARRRSHLRPGLPASICRLG
jgi:hypothetical protein